MAFYKKKWWRNLFEKKKKEKVDVLNDIEAILDFLPEIDHDVSFLNQEFQKLDELEKELEVGTEKVAKINLQTQAEIIEKLILRYESFHNDVDINGLRVKKIATHFLKKADHAGLKELVKEKKASQYWKLQW